MNLNENSPVDASGASSRVECVYYFVKSVSKRKIR